MQSTRHMVIFLAFLILFYAGFGVVVYSQLEHFKNLVENIHNHPLKVTKGTLTAARNVIRISRNVKDMLLVNDATHNRKRLAEIEQDEHDTDQNINLVLNRIEGEEGKVLVREAMVLIKTQKGLREKITAAIFAGERKKGEELARVDGIPLMKQLEESMAKIANYSDSQSMAYHIESVTGLKRAKVVLLSCGMIVLIFSIAFGAVAWNALRKSLRKSRVTVRDALKGPIKLDVVFETPSPGEIAEALNNFFGQINGMVASLKARHALLETSLKDLSSTSLELPSGLDEVSTKVDTVLEKISSVLDFHHGEKKSYKLPFELLTQIKGDLSLLAQIAATKDLLIEKLKMMTEQQKDEPEAEDVVDALRVHSKSMRENVDRTMRSVNGVIELLDSLLDRLDELRVTTTANQDIAKELARLEASARLNEDLAKNMQDISNEMGQVLNKFRTS